MFLWLLSLSLSLWVWLSLYVHPTLLSPLFVPLSAHLSSPSASGTVSNKLSVSASFSPLCRLPALLSRERENECEEVFPSASALVCVCVCVCLCANLCGLSLSPALSLSYSLPSMEERMISSPTQPPSPPEISLPFPRFPRPQKSTIKTSHGPEYISRAAPKNLQET